MDKLIASWLVLCCTISLGAAAQVFRDDFASYADSSSGEPAWQTDSVMWETRGGALRCDSSAHSFAVCAPGPYASEQVVEATVAISGKTTDQWRIAGICVVGDPRNYWHLALVEAPDADGSRHFVELVEAYEGAWLAEGAEGTRLTLIERSGGDLDWQYDHPYRLRLELGADRIAGTVSEPGGEALAHIAYLLDNPSSVRAGKPALDSGGFSSSFHDLRVQALKTAKPPEPPLPPPVRVRSWPGLRSAPTGFFRVEQRDGKWWMFDPRGRAFYVVGTDHANYYVHWCEALGYAPYHRNMVEKFGGEQAWAESTAARLRAWGFNTVAANHSPSLRYRGLAHVELLGFGTGFAASDDIAPQVHWTGFPNVFSPKWKQHCRKEARRLCLPARDDPWLIGYFLDNELEWWGKPVRPWGLADDAFRKPADHSAKRALVGFLRERYRGDIGAFNRAWHTDVGSFDALLALREPVAEGIVTAQADKIAFVRIVAERYFAGCAEAIRAADPNHLILGCRFAGHAPDIWDIAGKHCDIVSVNCYRQVDLERKQVIDFERDLRRWHELTGKPLMITEWSFPALDAGLPCKHGAGQRFDTQQQRAAAYRIFQELLFRTPYVVGSDYFMWVDEPAQGISKNFPEDSNYGLVNVNDEAYTELTQTAAGVNRMAYRLHAGRIAELRPVLYGDPPRLRLRNDGAQPARASVSVWIDNAHRDLTVEVAAGAEAKIALDVPTSPGAHFVQCVVDPEGTVAEGDRSDNEAHVAWYVPGLEPPAAAADSSAALIIANPSDEDLEQALVRAPIPADLRPVDAWHPRAGWIACSVDDNDHTLRLVVPDLLAHSAQAVLLSEAAGRRALTYEPVSQPLALTVIPGRAGEEEAAVLLLSGERVGRILPLIWQRTPRDQWVRPRSGPQMLVDLSALLRIYTVLSCDRLDVGGVIGRHDQPGQSPDWPRAFSCGYDIEWVRARPWFTARLRWLRSDDPHPWECVGYFHYLLPEFAARAIEPGVPNYYRPFGGWWDEERGVGIGVTALAPQDFSVYFWKDERGGLHPDARRDIDHRFHERATFAEPQPEIIIFAAKGESPREASLRIWRQARAERRIETTFAPAERRAAVR